jgi:hypothetical protein
MSNIYKCYKITKPHTPRTPGHVTLLLTAYVNDRYAALLQNYPLTSLDPSTWSRDLSFSSLPEVAKNHSQNLPDLT